MAPKSLQVLLGILNAKSGMAAVEPVWEIIVSRKEKPMGKEGLFGVWDQRPNNPGKEELPICFPKGSSLS